MKETVEYLIEYKGPGKRRYFRTFIGFKDKEFALKLAARPDIVSARVVEQRRKIIKVFPAKKHAGGVITPAVSGDKGKIDITAMNVDVKESLGNEMGYMWDGKRYSSLEEIVELDSFKKAVNEYIEKYGTITVKWRLHDSPPYFSIPDQFYEPYFSL
ncbi:MAG TPA: hypothetical protein ENI07_13195 [Desulfobacterales bacterium]|nr:hypothetical protein [Desulfobacterales bacterium]